MQGALKNFPVMRYFFSTSTSRKAVQKAHRVPFSLQAYGKNITPTFDSTQTTWLARFFFYNEKFTSKKAIQSKNNWKLLLLKFLGFSLAKGISPPYTWQYFIPRHRQILDLWSVPYSGI